MSSLDILGMCVRNLIKRKLRTSLTVLGVMIGTASIVVMISLGLAVNLKFEQEMENQGDMTVIQVYDYNYYNRARGSGGGMVMVSSSGSSSANNSEAAILDDNTIQKMQNLSGVVVATPILSANLYLKSGKYVMDNWSVMGLKPEAMQLLGYKPAEGRLLTEDDKYEMVFGAYTEKRFFNNSSGGNVWSDERFYQARSGEETPTYVDIFNDKMSMSYNYRYIWGNQSTDQEYDVDDENAPKPIKPIDVTVVGLLEEKNDYQVDGGIFMRIDVLKKIISDGEKENQSSNQESGFYSAIKTNDNVGYEQAYVKCKDLDSTKAICEEIRAMGFDAWYPAEWLNSMQEMAKNNQMLLAAIGAVSLFVAAIGIANTMIMSIYERTREIGVMKVIGASIRDIKWLFLLESAMIGFFGGGFGVALSYLVSYLLNNTNLSFFGGMFDYIGNTGDAVVVSLITPWLCGVALIFAAAVGLISGYFPARRAMRLSALEAIRTE